MSEKLSQAHSAALDAWVVADRALQDARKIDPPKDPAKAEEHEAALLEAEKAALLAAEDERGARRELSAALEAAREAWHADRSDASARKKYRELSERMAAARTASRVADEEAGYRAPGAPVIVATEGGDEG